MKTHPLKARNNEGERNEAPIVIIILNVIERDNPFSVVISVVYIMVRGPKDIPKIRMYIITNARDISPVVVESSLFKLCLVEMMSDIPQPTKLKAIKKVQTVRIDFFP